MKDIKLLKSVIGGGEFRPSALLLLLSLSLFTACTDDTPASQEPEKLSDTRTATDSTVVSSGKSAVSVDSTWADTLDFDFNGRPVGSVTLTLPDVPEEGDAGEAV